MVGRQTQVFHQLSTGFLLNFNLWTTVKPALHLERPRFRGTGSDYKWTFFLLRKCYTRCSFTVDRVLCNFNQAQRFKCMNIVATSETHLCFIPHSRSQNLPFPWPRGRRNGGLWSHLTIQFLFSFTDRKSMRRTNLNYKRYPLHFTSGPHGKNNCMEQNPLHRRLNKIFWNIATTKLWPRRKKRVSFLEITASPAPSFGAIKTFSCASSKQSTEEAANIPLCPLPFVRTDKFESIAHTLTDVQHLRISGI